MTPLSLRANGLSRQHECSTPSASKVNYWHLGDAGSREASGNQSDQMSSLARVF